MQFSRSRWQVIGLAMIFALHWSLLGHVEGAVPQLPRATVSTAMPAGWNGPANATPANAAELKAALANAVQDSGTYVIELKAGTTYSGSFVIGNKPGRDWLIIRSSGWERTPPVAEGLRVTAAAASKMATLQTTRNATLRTAWGAHHIRFIGIEFVSDRSMINLVLIGWDEFSRPPQEQAHVGHHIGFDRCILHSDSDTNKCRVAVALCANDFFLINSRIENIKDTADAQAVLIQATDGPILIDNNYLEATGENILSGGNGLKIQDQIPSDMTITRNHLSKRNEWDQRHADYNGINWGIKNLLELKMARRVYFGGNVLEHNWVDSQSGYAIVLTPRNQTGSTPWATVADVTIENCIAKRIARFCNAMGEDNYHPSEQLKRVRFANCLVLDHGGKEYGTSGRAFNFTTKSGGRPIQDFLVEHCTFLFREGHVGANFLFAEKSNIANVDGLVLRNNIFDDGNYAWTSNPNQIRSRLTNVTIKGNGIFFNPRANNYAYRIRPANFYNAFGAGNVNAVTIDAVKFTDHANLDYTLGTDSLFKDAATEGKDCGVDFAALKRAIDGVVTGDPGPVPKPPTPEATPMSLRETIAFLKSIDTSDFSRMQKRDLARAIWYLEEITQ